MAQVSEGEILEIIADALNEDITDIKPKAELSSLQGWDSMGTLLLMAEFDERFNLMLDQNLIEKFFLIDDIVQLLKKESIVI